VFCIPVHDVEGLPGGRGERAGFREGFAVGVGIGNVAPDGFADGFRAEVDEAEADGALGNVVPAATGGEDGGRAVLHMAEDGGGVGGGAVIGDPESFAGEFVDAAEIVPAGLLVGAGVGGFAV